MIQREPCIGCGIQPDTSRRRTPGTSVDLRFLLLIQVLLATRVPAQAARIIDSAGVITVSNPSVRSARLVYRLADTPSIDFGGEHADSMYELSPLAIFDAYRLPGGEIAVLNGYQVRIFDSAGRYLRSLGRAGAGPGEFQSVISELCPLRSDSVVVIEGTRPRFSVFAGAKAFVRTVAYQPGHVTYHGCLHDGSMIVQTAAVSGNGAPSAQYVLMGTDGRVIRTLGIWPARDVTTILPIESSIIGHDDQIYVGAGKSFEYRVYNAYGVLDRIVRTNDAPDRFTDADADLVVAKRDPAGSISVARSPDSRRLRRPAASANLARIFPNDRRRCGTNMVGRPIPKARRLGRLDRVRRHRQTPRPGGSRRECDRQNV